MKRHRKQLGSHWSKPGIEKGGLGYQPTSGRFRYSLIGLFVAVCAPMAMAQDDELDFLFADPAPAAEEPSEQQSKPETPKPASAPVENSTADEPRPYAQTLSLPKSTPPAQTSRKPGRVIEEIVVTAQKTEQTLQEVPVAVSVIGGETLRDSGVFGAEGIENLVPNIELDTDAQAPSIGVRGFSTDSYNVGLEPSVGIIVDDISLGRTEFIPDGLFDIDRVEVLRGPQGTLFGKNTIAGVMIFGTGQPQPDPAGSLLMTLGEDDQQRLEAMANVPLSENLFARVSAVGWNDGGEVRNTFLDRDELAFEQFGARLKLSYDASDRLQLRLGGQTADSLTDYAGWQLYDVDPDAFAYAQSKDPETEDDPFNTQTSFDLPGYVDHSTNLVHLAADYQFADDHNLVAIAGYADLENRMLMDFDVSAGDLTAVNVQFTYDQNSFELRSSGRFDLFGLDTEYVAGVFGFQSTMDIWVDVALGGDIVEFVLTPAGIEALGGPNGAPTSLLTELLLGITEPLIPAIDLNDGIFQLFEQESKSVATFGQMTVSLTDRVGLLAGLRVGQESKDAVLSVTSRGLGFTALVVGANDPPNTDFREDLKRRETEVSPKLGLQWEITDEISSYFSWTRGYKSGGFNAISFNSENLVFEPEKGDNFELGAKMRLFDASLALNTTLYRTVVSNMQVVNFNGVSFDVFNAAESVLQGFEADATWLAPWEWLTINGALAISRAEYSSYPSGPPTAEQSSNCSPVEECQQDLTGKTLPRAPKMTATLSPEVALPLGNNLGVIVAADLSYRGEQYLTLDLDPHGYVKDQFLLGARISIGPPDERWGITLRGSNITNEKALSFVADHNLFANSYFATQIPTRQLSLTLSANW